MSSCLKRSVTCLDRIICRARFYSTTKRLFTQDFFGIEEITVVQNEGNRLNVNENTNTDSACPQSGTTHPNVLRDLTRKRYAENKEMFLQKNFGQLRFDSSASVDCLDLQSKRNVQSLLVDYSNEILNVNHRKVAVGRRTRRLRRVNKSYAAKTQLPDDQNFSLKKKSDSLDAIESCKKLTTIESTDHSDKNEKLKHESENSYIDEQYFSFNDKNDFVRASPMIIEKIKSLDHPCESEVRNTECNYIDKYITLESTDDNNRDYLTSNIICEDKDSVEHVNDKKDLKNTPFDNLDETLVKSNHQFDIDNCVREPDKNSDETASIVVLNSDLHEIDEQYFGTYEPPVPIDCKECTEDYNSSIKRFEMIENTKLLQAHHQGLTMNSVGAVHSSTTSMKHQEIGEHEEHGGNQRRVMQHDKSKTKRAKNYESPIKDKLVGLSKASGNFFSQMEPDIAYETAMKIRRNIRLKVDVDKVNEESLEERRLLLFKTQKPDLDKMPSCEVVQMLADSVVFENDDFVAISKPYGLPSHGGPGVRVSVGQLLDPLSHYIVKDGHIVDRLYLVHRLDKETTGVMLLAKSREVAWQLLGMFKRREVSKVYWTLTKGCPTPSKGMIDVPLARENVAGVYRTVVKPQVRLQSGELVPKPTGHRDTTTSQAITEFSVLASNHQMSLVECRPTTGLQHQVRVHMGQVLNTPILGDHKYSHYRRLAPQKLHHEALQCFGIRQAQVRHIPMHLHAKRIVLPEWRGRHNVFIRADMPKFFLRNLKFLKIKIPDHCY